MKDISIQELKNTAVQMRMKVIDMIYKAQSGHPGGSLSAADFVTACYFKYMNLDPSNPRWPDRDRMVLSKGHVCPIQYACRAGHAAQGGLHATGTPLHEQMPRH